LAPVRFSTTTVCPTASASFADTIRATRSTAGPGGNGTTIVIDREATISEADAAGMFLVAIEPDRVLTEEEDLP
jgi:hypothetical protein